jgi:hypothetical protein
MELLPSIVLRHADRVRHALTQTLGSRDAADIIYHGMRLQARHGECFASATHLGFDVAFSRFVRRNGYPPDPESADMDRVRHNGKILTIRLIDQLRRAGLVRTTRRIRSNGEQGTNLVDFTALWDIIRPVVQQLIQSKEWHDAKSVWRAGRAFLSVVLTDTAQSLFPTAFRDFIPMTIPPLPPLVEHGVKKKNNMMKGNVKNVETINTK